MPQFLRVRANLVRRSPRSATEPRLYRAIAGSTSAAIADHDAALELQIQLVFLVALSVVEQARFGNSGNRAGTGVDVFAMGHGTEQVVRAANSITGDIGRIASGVARSTLARRAAFSVAFARRKSNQIGILIGRNNGDCAITVVVPAAVDIVGEQIMFDREGRQFCRTQRTTAALAHFLVIVEDINHRADRLLCADQNPRIGYPIGVDEPKNAIADATAFAPLRRGATCAGI